MVLTQKGREQAGVPRDPPSIHPLKMVEYYVLVAISDKMPKTGTRSVWC